MTRPRKQTVDYFPHSCEHGQTMFVLEQRFGNDGYAFWFKLLELLGKTEGHFLDCNKLSTWKYLAAKTLVTEERAREIVDLLSELEAIDSGLWHENQIIWSDNFLKGLAFAYRNRDVSIPVKPVIYPKKSGICGDMPDNECQKSANEMKVNEIKVNEIKDTPPPPLPGESLPPQKSKKRSTKRDKTPIPENFGISDAVRQWATENGHNYLEARLEHFKNYAVANGKLYADWDAAFRNAISGDWAHIKSGVPTAKGLFVKTSGMEALKQSAERRAFKDVK